ncbi:MAG TPA: hypothetical protein DCS75_05705 [Gemmatimonadetes bacterium]|nr:hypothetical protein [Gemmatimonadota bacterium]HBV06685.1 hypothetical protein [Gemmatimonadota bacterium]
MFSLLNLPMICFDRSTEKHVSATSGGGRVPTPGVSAWFIALVAVTFFWGGAALQGLFREPGLLAAEWLLLFVPTVAFIVVGRFDPVQTLSLRRPTLRQAGTSVVVISGALPLVWGIGWLQTFILPVPWELLESLEDLVSADTWLRLLWLLILLAFTPAICEEILFRGVLLSGTRNLDPWRIILLNGFVFGAFHLSVDTVIRFLPTTVLGMLIAWSVWRTGSIWIGVLMHFVHNGSIVLLASTPSFREIVLDPKAPPPLWLVFISVMIFAAGLIMLKNITAQSVLDIEASGPESFSSEEK